MYNPHPPLVIIESPYAAATPEGVQRHIDYARLCLMHSIQRGEAPFASHLLYTQPGILDDNKPSERTLGIELGNAWRDHADKVVFYCDLYWSTGMLVALDHVIQHKLSFRLRSLSSRSNIKLPAFITEDEYLSNLLSSKMEA